MLVLLVGGASVYLSARNPAEARIAQSLQKTSVDLRDAATALAVYSIGDDELPGSMPCPDFYSDGNFDGSADVDCRSTAGAVYVKRLPWKTIDVSREAGRLWYAMDSDFRNNPSQDYAINVGVEGSLTLDGTAGYAALIIDPGDVLEHQKDRPRDSNDVTDYLEGENADGDDDYQNCSGSDTCNDRIVGISVDQLMAVVQQRALGVVESALRQFHADHGFVPFAAKFSGGSSCDNGMRKGRIATSPDLQQMPGSDETFNACVENLTTDDFPDWINSNKWLEHIVYSMDWECTPGEMSCGDSTQVLKSDTGLAVVLAGAGTERDGQDRSSGTRDINDYLDSAENTDSDYTYDDATLSSEDNDVLRGFALPTS